MRSILLGLALIGSLAVAACDPVTVGNVTGQGIGVVKTVAGDNATVKQVQSYAQTACKFYPLASTVVSLISGGINQSVQAVGQAICDAITTNPLAEGDKPGYYKAAGAVVTPSGKVVKVQGTKLR